jgi:hypothetical protein
MALRDILVRFGVQVQGAEQITNVTKKTKEATGALADLGARLGALAKFTTLGYIANSLRGFISSQIETATALKYQAEKLGISTDELKKYQYVAARMKVPVNEMAVAMRFFNRAAGEVALGTKGTTRVFQQMGLSVKDANGNIKPTDQLLFEFSDKLAAIPSQAVRTAFAMRALGRGGSALLPVLQHGSAALKKQFELYEAFTGGPSEKVIRISDEIKGKLMLQQLGWKAIYSTLAQEVLPIVNKWLDRSNQNIKRMVDLAENTYGVATALRFLAVALPIVAMGVLAAKALMAGQAMKQLFTTMAMSGAIAALAAVVGTLYLAFDMLYSTLEGADTSLGHLLDDTKGFGAARQWVEDFKAALNGVVVAFLGPDASLSTFLQDAEDTFAAALPDVISVSVKSLAVLVGVIDTIITGLRVLLKLAEGVVGVKGAFQGAWDVEGGWEQRQKALSRVYDVAGEIPSSSPEYIRNLRKKRSARAAQQTGEDNVRGISVEPGLGGSSQAGDTGPYSSNAKIGDNYAVPNIAPRAPVTNTTNTTNTTNNAPQAPVTNTTNTTNNVTIHVAGTSATPQDIQKAVTKAMADSQADNRASFASVVASTPDPLVSMP